MKILLVDDDQQLVSFVRLGLEDHDMQVTTVYDGKMAERIATTGEFDVIVLDVMLPGINGFELCRRIRHQKVQTPVLMLTSLDSTDDKVTGFDTGADDYLSKPFDFPELLVRIRSLHRRNTAGVIDPLIRIADLEIDTGAKKVRRGGKEIRLTPTEYKIVELLSRHEGKVFDRIDIAQEIWGFSFNTGTNVIDVHISTLRKKVDRNFTPKLIHTVVGFGYVMGEQAS
jgi:two-component system, OmpR family, copper resistance phosphate regulon response regulator CusR